MVSESQHSPTTGRVKFYVQVDGGDFQVQTPYVEARNAWMHIQVEGRSATTTTSNDGCLKIWVNNNNYNSPSATSCNIDLETGGGWHMVRLGAYSNKGLQADGVHKILYSAFEAADSFDGNWYQAGGSVPTVPSAPTNLRIVPGE